MAISETKHIEEPFNKRSPRNRVSDELADVAVSTVYRRPTLVEMDETMTVFASYVDTCPL